MLRNLFKFPEQISPLEQSTLQLDRPRFVLQGIIDIVLKNFTLLIAIRVFQMSNGIKSVLSATYYIGMAISPWVCQLFASNTIPLQTNYVISLFLLLVGISFSIASFTSNGIVFLFAIIAAKISYKQTVPFVTDIYNRNYPKQRRGQIIGALFTILAISSALFAHLFAQILDQSLNNYHWIFASGAIASFLCCAIFFRMPNGRIIPGATHSLIRSNLLILFQDRLFSFILILWSLMSFAFQMTYPLRMEYLVNPTYGINFSNKQVALLIIGIPTVTRVLSAIFWGKIFDTKNFAVMKIMVNLAFLISIPMFFFCTNFWALAISSAILGIGHSGSLMAWQLWVTKIAPVDKLSAYVSLDVAIMGFRDAIAAALGYSLLSNVSLHALSIASVVLILTSITGFCFLIKNERLK